MDLPDFKDYNMEGRTYKYYHGEPLYPFGYGLSYTQFQYSNLEVNIDGEKIVASISIKNSGDFDGDEVVQVYARKADPKFWRPIKQLVGFGRISIKKGEQESIKIEIDKKQLQYWDTDDQKYAVEPGTYEFQVGSSSLDIRQTINLDLIL
jgi:beta-glucosidase